jgi:hypothetical protein
MANGTEHALERAAIGRSSVPIKCSGYSAHLVLLFNEGARAIRRIRFS